MGGGKEEIWSGGVEGYSTSACPKQRRGDSSKGERGRSMKDGDGWAERIREGRKGMANSGDVRPRVSGTVCWVLEREREKLGSLWK
jgi:hypothetical protein